MAIKQLTVTTVSSFSSEKSKAWNKYMGLSPNSTFFHLSGWMKVLKKTFGYEPCYLYAEADGELCGILPLFFINNFLSGKALVSLPFGVYGGICADDEYIAALLSQEAIKITKEKKASYLELRHLYNPLNNMPIKDLYDTFIKELPKDKDECLNQLPRKTRAATRKSLSFGLETEVGIHLLKDFYHIYSISVRNLGSPVFPYKYLTLLAEEFKDNILVMNVKYKGKVIASVFTFIYKDTVIPYYAGSLPQYFKMQPNNFMYLKLMEWGVENGYKYFDFGRSKKGTGSHHFKVLQGFKPKPLYYQYYLNSINEIPDLSPKNKKLKLVINTWKKLPVWLTKLIGPKISKLTPP
jgi:FemAB-related protein (PEP-CTERM system-associated)